MPRTQPLSEQKKNHQTLFGYIWIFAGMALFGWCFEKLGRWLVYPGDPIRDRGFLTLPFCPIYGTCVCIIGFFAGSPSAPSRFLQPLWERSQRWPKPLRMVLRFALYFLAVTLVATAVELFAGLLFKAAGIPLWNYSERWGNLFGVICPTYSLLWGVAGTALMSVIWRPICELLDRIPRKALSVVAVVLFCILFGDFTFNCIYVARTGHRFYFL